MKAGFVDKVVGVYHFLTDRTPGDLSLVNSKPRTVDPWCRDGQAVVAKQVVGSDLKDSVNKLVELLGGLERSISRGDKVLVKPNFNSPDPFPGSTDSVFLRAVVELLLEAGAVITIGESAGGLWRPTRNVLHKLGMYEMAKQLEVKLIAFEEEARDWVRVKIDGDYLKVITIPRSIYNTDKIVYLPCMKTHSLAGFSGALKLAMGIIHPGERRALHTGHLEEKIAEINLSLQPDLTIMDGRKAFISGGPHKGELVEPGFLLASGDSVAIDIEGMRILMAFNGKNKLGSDPFQSRQIATALKHGLSSSQGNYRLVQATSRIDKNEWPPV